MRGVARLPGRTPKHFSLSGHFIFTCGGRPHKPPNPSTPVPKDRYHRGSSYSYRCYVCWDNGFEDMGHPAIFPGEVENSRHKLTGRHQHHTNTASQHQQTKIFSVRSTQYAVTPHQHRTNTRRCSQYAVRTVPYCLPRSLSRALRGSKVMVIFARLRVIARQVLTVTTIDPLNTP